MKISSNNYNSIDRMRDKLRENRNQLEKQNDQLDMNLFKSILKNANDLTKCSGLKFSKHANERLASRKIDLTKEQIEKLEEGTNKAKSKGINESLVIVDDLFFIVSCKNNTVITAVNDDSDQVFTNIDGAVIM